MRFAHIDGDHLTLLNVYHAFKQSEFPSGVNSTRNEFSMSTGLYLKCIFAVAISGFCMTCYNEIFNVKNVKTSICCSVGKYICAAIYSKRKNN